ncbi:Rrf2 family transcriptional regulator [bacterium]|nr:Rrf2 family transcriptional regulator [bacterium]NBW99045.1 Rrf2 family transcriptional regulator [bacterium]NBX82094.1 Rrf2 family transcriptional regulator [bacterium]
MIRVNKKVEYGVLALLYLNEQESKSASVREMAANCAVPEALLSKVMQSIKNVGYVSAVYGNQGGYKLAKSIAEINLLDLTQTLDGPIQVAECLDPDNGDCPARLSCKIIDPMHVLNQKIIELFQATSVQQLAVKSDPLVEGKAAQV